MKSIAFIDSGIGGIPYMQHALRHIPGINTQYFADTAFFPYGVRKPGLLIQRLQELVEYIEDHYNPHIYVLACNTASVVALEHLRSRFAKPFIGTVPAIKPAALISANRRVGIMATSQTLQDPYLEDLIREYAGDLRLQKIAATELIEGIEHDFFRIDGNGHLKAIAQAFSDEKNDTVVLGCTHFIHLEELLQSHWKGNIRLVDSREGITRQIVRVINGLSLDSFPRLQSIMPEPDCSALSDRSSFFITSAERLNYYQDIAGHFCSHFQDVINVR